VNLSASWSEGQDLDSLAKAESLLGRLFDVLDEELSAVGRFDIEVITRLDGDKRELVRQLEELTAQENSGAARSSSEVSSEEMRDAKARVSIAAGEVRAMIYANSALLGEAIAAISAKLGVDSRVQGYDNRARTVGPTRRSSTTSI
jgi:flagellar biosynthesis/type III secretory pathway chaperone